MTSFFCVSVCFHVNQMENQSTIAQYILKGYSDIPIVNAVSTGIFLIIYTFGILGNIIVITVIIKDAHLIHPCISS